MRQIYDAIQAYQKKHGDLPKWLSDLVPDFVANREIFISPVERRTGESRVFGYSDPKLKASYIYEFSANTAGGTINQNRETPLTMKEWKTMQMAEFGPATPMLRCHLHDPVLNLSFSGELYETGLYWETDPNTLALVKRLGQGSGVRDAKTILVKVLDSENGQPISDVQVTASNRQSELGPLPPRVMTTDSQGQSRISLGGSHPRSVSLSFGKPGYANAPVRWGSEDAIPAEFTAKLSRAVTVGGSVRDPTGKPIAGVTVTVSGVVRDEVGQFLLAEYDAVQTDASGKWRSGRVLKDITTLQFKLTHPEFLPAEYDQAATDPPAAREVSKADLLAGRAVMELQPGVRVEGTVVMNPNRCRELK